MKNLKTTLLFTLAFIIFLSAIPTSILAEGGQNTPFSLESATIVEGEKNVELDREIKLTFSKNINNIVVQEHNSSCFDIIETETEISVLEKVITFDDQLDRDNRKNIAIEANLEEGKNYTIIIKKEIASKNGNTFPEDLKINFSTIGAAGAPNSFTPILYLGIGLVAIIILIIIFKRKKK